MYIVGIDPGVTGAWAVIFEDGSVDVYDLEFDFLKPYPRISSSIYTDSRVFIEVPTRHGPGLLAKTNQWFMFGQLVEMFPNFKPVYPQVWKRHFNLLKKDKDHSRLLAIELFPELENKLSRKKDHNRAEALLIARYGEECLD